MILNQVNHVPDRIFEPSSVSTGPRERTTRGQNRFSKKQLQNLDMCTSCLSLFPAPLGAKLEIGIRVYSSSLEEGFEST